MRILHLLNDINRQGNGIINVAVDLACAQAASGDTVAVASAGGPYDGLLARNAVKLFSFDHRSPSPLSLLSLRSRWKKIVTDFEPDIVHAHMIAGAVVARFLRNVGHYKLVTTVHNEHERKSKLMEFGDRVITVSESNKLSMARRGVDPAKLRVVVNGTLNGPRARLAPTKPIPKFHRPALLLVAGMYVRKGIADLLIAFEIVAAAHPAAHLYLVGDGPDMAQFKAMHKTLKSSDRVHFLGFHDTPQDLMRQADIFVMPSHREPFGLVFTEAMEVGCACVGTDVDGIPEILGRHGEFGRLVPPHDPAALAGVLTDLLNDPIERTRLAEAGRVRAQLFTVGRMAQQTNDVYRELTDPPAAPIVRGQLYTQPDTASRRDSFVVVGASEGKSL